MHDQICLICREEVCDYETLCKHFYHNSCLKEWRKKSNLCPYCFKRLYLTPKVIENDKMLQKYRENPNLANSDLIRVLRIAIQQRNIPLKPIFDRIKENGFSDSSFTEHDLINFCSHYNRRDVFDCLLDFDGFLNYQDSKGKTLLMFLIKIQNFDFVAAILEMGVDVNARTWRGTTALHFACKTGIYELIKILLENGADAKAINRDKRSTLMMAAQFGIIEIFDLLISYGADVNACNSEDENLAFLAAKTCLYPAFKYLVDKGMDINIKNRNGMTLLHHAAHGGHLDVVHYIVAQGFDVNAVTTDYNETVLYKALIARNFDVAIYLLDLGADASIKSSFPKNDMFKLAIDSRQPHLAKRLLDNGFQLDFGEKFNIYSILISPTFELEATEALLDTIMDKFKSAGKDPNSLGILHHCAQFQLPYYLRKGIEKGLDVNYRIVGIRPTPIFYVKDKESLKILVENGADIEAKNEKGWTPLLESIKSLFVGRKVISTFYILIEMGANVFATDFVGRTALHIAADIADYTKAKKLISLGLTPDAQDKQGKTVLHSMLDNYNFYYAFPVGTYYNFYEVLLLSGADINLKSNSGESFADLVVTPQHSKFYNKLMEYKEAKIIKN